jgi:hypothetical protein
VCREYFWELAPNNPNITVLFFLFISWYKNSSGREEPRGKVTQQSSFSKHTRHNRTHSQNTQEQNWHNRALSHRRNCKSISHSETDAPLAWKNWKKKLKEEEKLTQHSLFSQAKLTKHQSQQRQTSPSLESSDQLQGQLGILLCNSNIFKDFYTFIYNNNNLLMWLILWPATRAIRYIVV